MTCERKEAECSAALGSRSEELSCLASFPRFRGSYLKLILSIRMNSFDSHELYVNSNKLCTKYFKRCVPVPLSLALCSIGSNFLSGSKDSSQRNGLPAHRPTFDSGAPNSIVLSNRPPQTACSGTHEASFRSKPSILIKLASAWA